MTTPLTDASLAATAGRAAEIISTPRPSAPSQSADAVRSPFQAHEADRRADPLIVLEDEPRNLESRASVLRALVTPTDHFYIRNHFPEPEIDATAWRLRVEGAVERTLELSYRDLRGMPSRTQTSMIECAGNGRAFLVPREHGAQWVVGAAGNAVWTGVPLDAILARAGLTPAAVDVVLEGADHGEVEGDPGSPGDIHYAHSIPVAKAMRGDVLVACEMNGENLTRGHGFPARVIVPGWYGMAAVKWLQRLVVTDRPFHGFFESVHYTRWERTHGTPTLVPLSEMHVKSVILTPWVHSRVEPGAPCAITGLAWTGRGTIERVEVSVDGGESWAAARLTSPACEFAWRSWALDWPAPRPGRHVLMARATDTLGRTQPLTRDRDRRTYEITHVVGTPVVVG